MQSSLLALCQESFLAGLKVGNGGIYMMVGIVNPINFGGGTPSAQSLLLAL